MTATTTAAVRSGGAPDLGLFRVLRDDGTADPATDPCLSDADLIRLHTQMLLIRTLDERCLRLQRQGRIAFYGTSTGQEAATVGSAFCLEAEDWCFPALREGGAALMRGMPVSRYIAQLMGNAHDEEKGHQQPMHFSWRGANHVSLSSPIGTQIPQAVGCARAMQVAGATGRVVLGFIGDGGTSEPDFHVGLTFAGVWKCPVVVVCQNNGWAISVPTSAQTASPTIAVKGRGYGIPSVRVDGNDILAVVKVTRDAISRARRGEGPTFIEAVTYRRHGHSSSDDPTRYRDPAEVERWEKNDPVERFRAHLVARGLWSAEAETAEIDRQNEMVTREIQEAEKAAPPSLDTIIEDVTEFVRPELREQLAEVRPFFEEGKTAEGAFPL
ncbi:MAG: 3-methyl-2-oxobutanoate dehydrogenase [Planctomycetes bacterium]|nr:3-methyl-2-oxobutanoate dehydrogenase [Planctomycetota bacterium]